MLFQITLVKVSHIVLKLDNSLYIYNNMIYE